MEEKCVRAIVGGALNQFHDANNDAAALDSSRRTLSRVHGLLDRISGSSSAENDAWVFETMAVFHEQTGQDSEKVLETLTKEYRALQTNASWEKDNALVQKVCLVVSHMVHIYKQVPPPSGGDSDGDRRRRRRREGLVQARFALRGVIQKIQTARPGDATIPPEVKRLEVLLLEIDEALLLLPSPSSSSSSQAAVLPSST